MADSGTFDNHGETAVPPASTINFDGPTEFAAAVNGFDARYLPTTNDHRFTKFELALESGRLMIVTRPPMLFEGAVVADEGVVMFQLQESPKFNVNGSSASADTFSPWKKGTGYRGYHQSRLTHCSLFVATPLSARDWPDAAGRMLRTGAVESSRVRACVSGVIEVIRRDPARIANPNVLKGIDESIIAGLDQVLCTVESSPDSVATGRYLKICRQAEEYLRESRFGMQSNRDVAQACGVSARTLHNAFVSVLGISVRRYILLHRLWLARHALLRASGDDLVKSIALDHGFWHLGRFSSLYHATFGEAPSTTLARGFARN